MYCSQLAKTFRRSGSILQTKSSQNPKAFLFMWCTLHFVYKCTIGSFGYIHRQRMLQFLLKMWTFRRIWELCLLGLHVLLSGVLLRLSKSNDNVLWRSCIQDLITIMVFWFAHTTRSPKQRYLSAFMHSRVIQSILTSPVIILTWHVNYLYSSAYYGIYFSLLLKYLWSHF